MVPPKTTRASFQTLIGTVKTASGGGDDPVRGKFQTLIGTVKTGRERF